VIPKDDGSKQTYSGLSSGRIAMIIGKSGTGKSTLALQMGVNIIKKYENGLMYVFDFEQNNTKERIRMVTGVSEDYYDKHISIQRNGITTESLLRTLSKIKELKLKNKDELLVDNENGIKDKDGNIIQVLPPTVVIVDSLAMMLPEDNLAEEEIQGSMAATSIAKVNSQFFKKALSICQAANIILIEINHITQQISIGVTPPSAQVNYLKQDEAISGGKAALYVVDTLVKLTVSTKLEEDKLYGIKGFEVKAEICKSRHAPAGRSVNMIYDQLNGFSDELSLLDFMKSNGLLKGNGMAYYIDGYDTVKFRLSNFRTKLTENPEFKEYFFKKAEELLKGRIKESSNFSVEEGDSND
jgi:RecA/RadA recombinase